MKRVLVAGASGFIGRHLVNQLIQSEEIEVIALSRQQRESKHPRLHWKKCDLFSLQDVLRVMEGCDFAYYLVHSMLPSASLTQGSFYDFDLLMADNFARAAQQFRVKQLIYLGGMIPDQARELSWHLKSRQEVETVLKESGVPITILRAGLVIGPGGSSFTILKKLVERLPMMVCPAWTLTLSQPVALADVVQVLQKCLGNPETESKTFDIGGPEVLTYQNLILKTASIAQRKPKLMTLNLIPLKLSRWWVSLITGAPKDLVYPLVLSLKYPMIVSDQRKWIDPNDLQTSLDRALKDAMKSSQRPFAGAYQKIKQRDVRSIQRLALPHGKTAEWVMDEFFRWLPRFWVRLIHVKTQKDTCFFYCLRPQWTLLKLRRVEDQSRKDRQVLSVEGGFLVTENKRGRFEFREVLGKNYVMAAIHDYRPKLPWFVYRFTQAGIHHWVMNQFAQYLVESEARQTVKDRGFQGRSSSEADR